MSIFDNNLEGEYYVHNWGWMVKALKDVIASDKDAHDKIAEILKIIPEEVRVAIGEAIENGTFTAEINRWLENIKVINVKDFGAKGDGKTDDSASIQNAVDSSPFVYFPEGTYMCHDISIPSDVTIVGAGTTNTILKCPIPTDCIFQTQFYEAQVNQGYNSGSHNFSISFMTLDGDNKCKKNMRFIGYRYVLNNLYVMNAETGLDSQWSLQLGEGDDKKAFECYISDCFFERCSQYGIWWNGAHDSIFSNCFVRLCKNGIHVLDTDFSYASGTIFSNCHVYACEGYGIFSDADIIFENTISESNGYNAVNTENSKGFILNKKSTLNNCHSFNNKGGGILLNSDRIVAKCYCYNNKPYDYIFQGKNFNYIENYGQTGTFTGAITTKSYYRQFGDHYYSINPQPSPIYNAPKPTNTGESNAVGNPSGNRCLVLFNKPLNGYVIKPDKMKTYFYQTSVIILEALDQIYFTDENVQNWTWIPML